MDGGGRRFRLLILLGALAIIASGFLPKRNSKSRMPQWICVRLSRSLASGRMMWL